MTIVSLMCLYEGCGGSVGGVEGDVMNYDVIVSKFELQSR